MLVSGFRFLTRSQRILLSLLFATLYAIILRCAPDQPDNLPNFNTPASYLGTAKALIVDVAYEPGAEPYTGTTASGLPVWSILSRNLDSLVACRPRIDTVAVPNELLQMQLLPAQNRSAWNVQAIVSLAGTYQPRHSTPDTGILWIAFLNGYYDRGTAIDSNVIGVSLSETGIITIFKEVVTRSGTTEAVRRFVEQSTLVHETGHSLGLVNNGVPMASPHEDTAHVHHCSDPDCVMYWANEGVVDMARFAQRYLTSGKLMLFCNACRGDICVYQP